MCDHHMCIVGRIDVEGKARIDVHRIVGGTYRCIFEMPSKILKRFGVYEIDQVVVSELASNRLP